MGEPKALSKHQRQHRIALLLSDVRVTSQAHLAELLTGDGIDVNPFVSFPKGAGPGGVSALALDAVVIGRDAPGTPAT